MTTTVTVTPTDGSATVTVYLAPEPPSEERMADMSVMFGAFLLAAIVIYFGRQLLRLFEASPHED